MRCIRNEEIAGEQWNSPLTLARWDMKNSVLVTAITNLSIWCSTIMTFEFYMILHFKSLQSLQKRRYLLRNGCSCVKLKSIIIWLSVSWAEELSRTDQTRKASHWTGVGYIPTLQLCLRKTRTFTSKIVRIVKSCWRLCYDRLDSEYGQNWYTSNDVRQAACNDLKKALLFSNFKLGYE